MKRFLLSAFLVSVFSTAAFSQGSDLFFSEYLEGSSNNKAIEVFNPTAATVDLSNYKIYRYNNGSVLASDSLTMQGLLAPGGVYVAGNPSAVAAILAESDTLHTITFFNGDDAMSLYNIATATMLDVIGMIGNDPGTNWVVGTGATSEFTLVRASSVTAGTLNWTVGATQWDVYPQNTFAFLGAHTYSVLPVKLVSFTGKLQSNIAELQWQVEAQQGILSYEVQKSLDGVYFNSIASVAANTLTSYTYQYRDAVSTRKAFYRILVKEHNKETHSKVIHLNARQLSDFQLYPTVTSQALVLQSSDASDLNTRFCIFNNIGVKVMTKQLTQLPMILDVAALPSGTYFLQLQRTEKTETIKFIKQ